VDGEGLGLRLELDREFRLFMCLWFAGNGELASYMGVQS
jgi:hypothetical protein